MPLKTILPFYLVFLFLSGNICFGQQPKLMLPIAHIAPLHFAEFSPDGKRIVTASYDNTSKIWDAVTGKLIADLKGNTAGFNSAQFSPDGKKIVTTYRTGIIWDVITGTLIAEIIGHRGLINSAQFSPDGKKIVTAASDKTSKIWDAVTGEIITDLKGHTGAVLYAQFSPDGKKIITASSDKTGIIWDVVTGTLITILKGHTDQVWFAQFSRDGKKIVTASYDKTSKIWDAATGNLFADLKGHTGRVMSTQFSPDGKKIVTSSDDETAKIWDAVSGELVADLKGHTAEVFSAQFSPDGKKIVTASNDKFAKIWDAVSGEFIADLKGHINDVTYAQFSPDGKKIVTASYDTTAKIWDAVTGKHIIDLKGHTAYVSITNFSPDGKKIVTTLMNHTAKIWDIATGRLFADLNGHTERVMTTQFSPDGKKIVTASMDSSAKIWDAASGKIIADLKDHTNNVNSAAFSPDGKNIATSSSDETAKIWDAFTGKLIADLRGHTNGVVYAQFSPDGKKIVTASYDKTSKIWEVASGKLIADLRGHTEGVNSAQFSPDGKKIVTTSSDRTIKIWDAASGKLIADLKGHIDDFKSAQFSPDGKKITTYSKIWDVATGTLIKEIKTEFGVLSPDGKINITTSANGTTKIQNTETGKILYTFFAVDSTDYLIVDEHNYFDGTENARKLLYFTCGTEVIELDQVKDQLWVPNLAERIMKGETINAKTLDELNICGLTPEVEDATDKAGEYYFKIKPRRSGLGETVVLVNGIEARRYKPAELKKNGEVYDLVINKAELTNLFIDGKENPVTVKAYTADNAISSRGLKVVEDKTKEIAALPNLYAVMVGVSDYKGTELDLKYAAKDANDMSAAVSAAAKKLLNTDGKEHVFMYNLTTADVRYQLPEKNSIKKLLEEIGRKATANDILMIFFAGHGVMAGEAEKKQFYFLTADASGFTTTGAVKDVGISTTELVEWMKPQNIKAQKRILIFDACNSGQAINDIAGKDLAVRNDDKAQQTKAIDKLNEKSGLFILSASASNQAAYEMGRYSQGLLTYSLLKAIKQQPDILEDGKYLDVSRWFNAAEKTVNELSKENGARQEPQIVSNTNFNIGIVDDEVMAKIILPQEKPLFAASNFQNSDEAADGDNLDLSKLINLQLNEIASRGTESEIVYIMATNSSDAVTLSGRYDVKGDDIVIRVSIKKNNDTKYRFEEKGTKHNLKVLVAAIVKRSSAWAAANK